MNRLERRDLARVVPERSGNTGGTTESTSRLTINDPWRLEIPQAVMDHIEQTSAMTGMRPEQIVAATIVAQYESAVVEKKKSPDASPQTGAVRRDVSSGRQDHANPLQLLLPLGGGPDQSPT